MEVQAHLASHVGVVSQGGQVLLVLVDKNSELPCGEIVNTLKMNIDMLATVAGLPELEIVTSLHWCYC